jgi:hypothetical protein
LSASRLQTRVDRQDELIAEILSILRPQLDGQPVLSEQQRHDLQSAVARFALDVRAE